jgi:hypothetical protein
LYDLSETKDLASGKPDELAALQKQLEAWKSELVAPK